MNQKTPPHTKPAGASPIASPPPLTSLVNVRRSASAIRGGGGGGASNSVKYETVAGLENGSVCLKADHAA